MTSLDRFLNPVWHEISKLEDDDQLAVSTIVVTYGASRHSVSTRIIEPFEEVFALAAPSVDLRSKRRSLLDEAFLGLCRCCTRPIADPAGRLQSAIVQALPELWASLALSDAGGCQLTLDGTGYSADVDEARTQVAVKWMSILKVTDAGFIRNLAAQGYVQSWGAATSHLVNGLLIGVGRTAAAAVVSNAKRDMAKMHHRQRAVVMYLASRVAGSARAKGDCKPLAPQDHGTASPERLSAPPVKNVSIDLKYGLGGVRFGGDGWATVTMNTKGSRLGPLVTIAVVGTQSLGAADLAAAEEWNFGKRLPDWRSEEYTRYALAEITFVVQNTDVCKVFGHELEKLCAEYCEIRSIVPSAALLRGFREKYVKLL